MNNSILKESPCLERLSGVKFYPDLKWYTYIRRITKAVGEMDGTLYRPRKHLTPFYHTLSLKDLTENRVIAVISELELTNLHFSALAVFKSIYAILRVMAYSFTLHHLFSKPQRCKLKFHRYFHDNSPFFSAKSIDL